jgi:Tfp pilus assembly protein PilZ
VAADRNGQVIDDARAHPRYEVNAYVDIVADDVQIYHKIQNVSVGGICLQTPVIQEVGQVVDVVLNFPDLGAQVAIKGQVVWANREPPQDVGIRWVDLDDERRELLKKYISLVKTREVSAPTP